MSKYEDKYNIKEDKKLTDFHLNRRMFCIYNDKVEIAPVDVSYSHADWFEKEGWMTKDDDKLMDLIPRGIINDQEDIIFYVGNEFAINKDIELLFFKHLKELVNKLDLDTSKQIFGGLTRGEPNTIWPPTKSYGTIADNL